MSKEKQIEEMAEKMIEIQQNFNEYCAKPCRECELGGIVNCESHYKAEALYNAGYRKQSENVIELPCKVGDTVYVAKLNLCGAHQTKAFIITHIITEETLDGVSRRYRADGVCPLLFTSEKLGKTVFLTREEAEKALKEREGK